MAEIVFRFPTPTTVSVAFDGTDSGEHPFTDPLSLPDREALRWYLETYAARSLDAADDDQARRIRQRLAEIGQAPSTPPAAPTGPSACPTVEESTDAPRWRSSAAPGHLRFPGSSTMATPTATSCSATSPHQRAPAHPRRHRRAGHPPGSPTRRACTCSPW